MKWVKFNVNDMIRVRLTEVGRQVYAKRQSKYDEFLTQMGMLPLATSKIPDVDADGWSTFQMHDFMNIFGEATSMGQELPFETEIEFMLNED